jgi:hypothetical protein
LRSWFFVYF